MFVGHLRLIEDTPEAMHLARCAASRFAGEERNPPVHDGLVSIGRFIQPGEDGWQLADQAVEACAGALKIADWSELVRVVR
jgi:hypothetical protein